MRLWPRLVLAVLLGLTACRSHVAPAPVGAGGSDALEPLSLERLQRDTFRYFWHTTNRATGLAPDRYPSASPASIAAIGFALSAYAVCVERGYISRAEARERTRPTPSANTPSPIRTTGPHTAKTPGGSRPATG